MTKRDSDGSALSSASAPTLVARMLEQLAAQPGERILEIGAATGFNAALLAELVGPHGHVVTIEHDRDLTEGALDAITRTGYTDRVKVRCGDGALGAADRAPFDGIIVTVGAVTIPDAWWDQLTPAGRMIVPLQLHPSGLTRSLRLHRTSSDTAVSTQQLVCGFVPMRGQSAAVATHTRLADDILLNHAPTDTDHTTGLADALASEPSWQHWTGLTIDATSDSVLHLDLWLATQQPIPFGRLSVSHEVREAGIADPSLRWSGAALFRDPRGREHALPAMATQPGRTVPLAGLGGPGLAQRLRGDGQVSGGSEMTTVLVVVAHPDDAEIAMGMRMHWYASNGARVRVHCLTTGAPGPDGTAVRREECLNAGALLGVDHYTFSSIPDTRFVEHRGRINADLFSVFQETRPDIVYTHYPGDQHLDHGTTAQEVTAVAQREARNLCYFRSPYSIGFEPTMFFMGTQELLDVKMRALKCFGSQQQIDMDVVRQLAEVAHRQYLHHRVVEGFPRESSCAELFSIARRVELADQTVVGAAADVSAGSHGSVRCWLTESTV